MFRKAIFAFAATAALGVAVLAPTAASADSRYWRHRDHSTFSFRFFAPYSYAYYPRCYIKRQWVQTRWGWRLRDVRVCR